MTSEAGTLQREWAKTYGKVLRAVGPFGIERVQCLSARAMQKVLVDDWAEYPRPAFMRNILGITAGYGLLTVTGEEHRTMRKTMNPAFSIPSLTAQTDMFYTPVNSLVNILKAQLKSSRITGSRRGAVFHVYDWLSKVTLDIICLTAFGYEVDSLHNPKSELADAYHQLLGLQSGANLGRIILIVSIPGVPRLLRTNWMYRHRRWLGKLPLLQPVEIQLMHRIKRVSAQILNEKIAEAAVLASGDSTLAGKKDVMSLLVQSRMQDKHSLHYSKMTVSDSMMMEQALTFLGAGHETTASGLAWTLWLLATHLDAQDKLRSELSAVLTENTEPDFRTLKSMEYLDQVIMESLRIYPPVPMTVRKANKSDHVDGTFIPKGTLLNIVIRVINTYQGFWGPDAEEFRPERWTDLASAPAYHPMHSFQTFINGPHHCIGKTMAVVEMKAVLSILIANFKFSPAYPGQKAQPTAAITMKPADNLPLNVEAVET